MDQSITSYLYSLLFGLLCFYNRVCTGATFTFTASAGACGVGNDRFGIFDFFFQAIAIASVIDFNIFVTVAIFIFALAVIAFVAMAFVLLVFQTGVFFGLLSQLHGSLNSFSDHETY
jgi:hypothetical protein